jgi:hypothetical protein
VLCSLEGDLPRSLSPGDLAVAHLHLWEYNSLQLDAHTRSLGRPRMLLM